MRDSRGFLWFCTAEGLSLFDGYRFTNFGVDQGLPNPYVTAILETREGEYWVATYDGLCKFDPKGIAGKLQLRPPARGRTSPFIRCSWSSGRRAATIGLAPLQRCWKGVTARSGAARGTGSTVSRAPAGLSSYSRFTSRFPLCTQKSALSMRSWRTGYGTLWVGAASGLCRRWPDGTVARYSRTAGLPDDNVHALLADCDGHVWVGTRYGGLLELATDASRRPPTVTRAYNHGNGFIADWIFAVNELEDGRLWVGTNTGLAEFPADDRKRDKPSHVYGKENGFIYHEIAVVSEDRDGNVWLGTVNGAMKLARNGFLSFGQEDGIVTATPLFELDGREMYFSGYVPRNPRAATPLGRAAGSPRHQAAAILVRHRSLRWRGVHMAATDRRRKGGTSVGAPSNSSLGRARATGGLAAFCSA